ncbi:MAG: hypothetical protein GY711_09070 [bacterium]|nr:hypothetical protein [bacterium]
MAKKKRAAKPRSKAESPKRRATRTSKTRSTRKTTKAVGAEYLVLRVGNKLKVGDTLRLVGVAASLDDAKALVGTAGGTSPQRLAVLEKKALLQRKPAIEVVEVAENIVNG